MARVAEGWQIGSILTASSGVPFDVNGVFSLNQFTSNGYTASAATAIDKGLGEVTKNGQGVYYFSGLRQIPDPQVAGITTLNNVQGQSGLRAIADASGTPLIVNPAPGTLGNLQPGFFEGPGSVSLDVNLIKRFRLRESKELLFNAQFLNLPNHASFSNPSGGINGTNFGQITSTSNSPRVIVFGLRLNF